MRIFTYGEAAPQIPGQPEQTPLTFKAIPYYTEDKEIAALSLPDEMLANKDKFPVVEDFELVIIDGRQNPPEKSLGCDIFARFVDSSKEQCITYWEIYYVDTHGPERCLPIPAGKQLIYEMEAGYQILIAADEAFVYIAQADDEIPPVYTRYCKVPRGKYESEWKEFVEWYYAHPEKRHPHPTPAERYPSPGAEAPQQKHGTWLSKFFK